MTSRTWLLIVYVALLLASFASILSLMWALAVQLFLLSLLVLLGRAALKINS